MPSDIKDYLKDAHTMQLATSADDQPWVCTVFFIEDKELNLYWLSLPSRRHSKNVMKNNKAAVAIQIKTSQPVIGIQAEGEVIEVDDEETVKELMQKYIKKYNAGKDFYDNFVRGKNQHKMYKFKPAMYVLFDEMNNIDDPRREIKLHS
jgi:uncharacterized protein YhbP (UPF0306 family)